MSWKFWRHDRAPRLEVDDTWFGYRYAGIRTTPERQHARAGHRLRAAVLDDGRQHPVHHGPRDVRADRRRELLALHHHPEAAAEPRGASAARTCSPSRPFSTPITGKRDGIIPRLYTMDNDFQMSHEARRERQLQRRRRLRQPGLHGDRVDGPDLRPQPGAARLDRPGHHPDAAHPAVGGQGPRRGQGAAGPGRRLPRRSAARRRSSSRARTGGSSAPTPTRSSRRRSASSPDRRGP